MRDAIFSRGDATYDDAADVGAPPSGAPGRSSAAFEPPPSPSSAARTTLGSSSGGGGAMFDLSLAADVEAELPSATLGSPALRRELRALLPPRVQHRRLSLCFSTAHHG